MNSNSNSKQETVTTLSKIDHTSYVFSSSVCARFTCQLCLCVVSRCSKAIGLTHREDADQDEYGHNFLYHAESAEIVDPRQGDMWSPKLVANELRHPISTATCHTSVLAHITLIGTGTSLVVVTCIPLSNPASRSSMHNSSNFWTVCAPEGRSSHRPQLSGRVRCVRNHPSGLAL